MRRALAATLALAALAACQRGAEVREFTFHAFGTLVELQVVGADAGLAERARAHAAARLDRWHADWHAWQPGPLTRLNRDLAEQGRAALPDELAGVLPRARELSQASGGLADPGIGALVALWGFHADEPPAGPPPDEHRIRALLQSAPGIGDLEIDNGRARSANPALQLDLGAFAKGIALARLDAELVQLGLDDFLLNAGGDLVARGTRGTRPWRVGIREPRGAGVLASLEVNDGEAVFTSGDYERYFEWRGERYHHLIDPRSGRPARGTRSATVITRDAALGDAAATALFVAGPSQWAQTARRMGVDLAMLVAADGTVHLTPGMAERIAWEAEPRPDIRIETP